MRVLILSEQAEARSSFGRQRRIHSLKGWAIGQGCDVAVASVLQAGDDAKGWARVGRTLRWRPPAGPMGPDVLLVCGLASPHMLIAAILLSRTRRVVFDACDSWRLLGQSLGANRSPKCILEFVSYLVARCFSRRMITTYISSRDAVADFGQVSRRRVFVIPQLVDDGGLEELAGVEVPLSHIVVAYDAASPHNRVGAQKYLPIVASASRAAGARVLAFGANGLLNLPDGVEAAGWVPLIRDVYTGNAAVFVTNIAGSGIPNKVLEANAARRPLILHDSLSYLSNEISVPAYWFSGTEDLGRAVEDCINGQPPPSPPAESTSRRLTLPHLTRAALEAWA